MCNDSNTQYFHPSNGEVELDTDNYIAPLKTPDYCPNDDDNEMLNTDKKMSRRTALRHHNQD